MTDEIIHKSNSYSEAKDAAAGFTAFTGRETSVEQSGGNWYVSELKSLKRED